MSQSVRQSVSPSVSRSLCQSWPGAEKLRTLLRRLRGRWRLSWVPVKVQEKEEESRPWMPKCMRAGMQLQ